MANDAHLAVLKQGVDAWNAWRATQADARPDFSNANLRGRDLANIDLLGADLRKTDLRGTILRGAALNVADLAGANFFKAVLDGANLSGANLIGARFLDCAQLMSARNWQSASRDPDLACDAPVPWSPNDLERPATMPTQPTQRFRSSGVLRMFPTFVWKGELAPDVYEPINDAVLRTLGDIGAPLADLKPGESWQSDHGLHELDPLREIVDCIDAAAESVLGYLKIDHEGFKITGCWANLNAPGAGHQTHSHPNNYLSGIYYVRTYPGADTVNFLDPRPQTGIICPPVTGLTAENTEEVVVTVKDGMLLMFPAWLRHSVDPNRSSRARISLGFNIMFAAYTDVMARPSWIPGRRP